MTLPRGRPRALPITFRLARPCCHCRGGAWANALVGCPTLSTKVPRAGAWPPGARVPGPSCEVLAPCSRTAAPGSQKPLLTLGGWSQRREPISSWRSD